ncbi:sigma-70 family RNA polymerase sigma factor [Candidatus Peregrinibacteria bacterium]|nr:sigma-70 family RNA polymerase sigma factor [Candidatus Peregrinibacteria bacterium]
MSESNEYTPEQMDEIVARAQGGDTGEFEKIYNAFIDKVYRYIYFRVNEEDAIDLTESVFLKIWENLGTYKVGKLYFNAWVFKIAHNLIVDSYRSNKNTTSLEFEIVDEKKESDPVLQAERSLSKEVLRNAIKSLKKKYQQVILLKYINELDNREIARIMNRSEGSLRILKFRALKALKQILSDQNITF